MRDDPHFRGPEPRGNWSRRREGTKGRYIFRRPGVKRPRHLPETEPENSSIPAPVDSTVDSTVDFFAIILRHHLRANLENTPLAPVESPSLRLLSFLRVAVCFGLAGVRFTTRHVRNKRASEPSRRESFAGR